MLATATSAPNWIISGSFWNCGAPPDSEIAVAIVTAMTTVAMSVAAKAATQSSSVGAPVGEARRWKTVRATAAEIAKLLRLNANFSGPWRK